MLWWPWFLCSSASETPRPALVASKRRFPPQGPPRFSLSQVTFHQSTNAGRVIWWPQFPCCEVERLKLQQISLVPRVNQDGLRLQDFDVIIYDRFFFSVRHQFADAWEEEQWALKKQERRATKSRDPSPNVVPRDASPNVVPRDGSTNAASSLNSSASSSADSSLAPPPQRPRTPSPGRIPSLTDAALFPPPSPSPSPATSKILSKGSAGSSPTTSTTAAATSGSQKWSLWNSLPTITSITNALISPRGETTIVRKEPTPRLKAIKTPVPESPLNNIPLGTPPRRVPSPRSANSRQSSSDTKSRGSLASSPEATSRGSLTGSPNAKLSGNSPDARGSLSGSPVEGEGLFTRVSTATNNVEAIEDWEKEFPDLFPPAHYDSFMANITAGLDLEHDDIMFDSEMQRELEGFQLLSLDEAEARLHRENPQLQETMQPEPEPEEDVGPPKGPRPVKFSYQAHLDTGVCLWIQDTLTGQFWAAGPSPRPTTINLADLNDQMVAVIIIPVESVNKGVKELALPSTDPNRSEFPRWESLEAARKWADRFQSPTRLIMCARITETRSWNTGYIHWQRDPFGNISSSITAADNRRDVQNREIRLLDPRDHDGQAMAESGDYLGETSDPLSIFYDRSRARVCLQSQEGENRWGVEDHGRFYTCYRHK